MPDWKIYTGSRVPHDDIGARLPAPPPWRRFGGGAVLRAPAPRQDGHHPGLTYLPSDKAISQVNAALYLRRPLLVTGPPGTGKSTLAHAVAHELKLGPVLHWPITSRSTLREGLYEYDPLTRLYAAQRADADDIGGYIRLGPLGTALLPYGRPRVLLIDEIDKSDIDLPNDLLTIFETGSYEIVELARRAGPVASVMTADSMTERAEISNGTVACNEFPLVIMTSNGEREFPPAFLRRCLSLELKQPGKDELTAIVSEHLGGVLSGNGELPAQARDIIGRFLERSRQGDGKQLATDQLLNAIYLCHSARLEDQPQDALALADQVMPYLNLEANLDDH